MRREKEAAAVAIRREKDAAAAAADSARREKAAAAASLAALQVRQAMGGEEMGWVFSLADSTRLPFHRLLRRPSSTPCAAARRPRLHQLPRSLLLLLLLLLLPPLLQTPRDLLTGGQAEAPRRLLPLPLQPLLRQDLPGGQAAAAAQQQRKQQAPPRTPTRPPATTPRRLRGRSLRLRRLVRCRLCRPPWSRADRRRRRTRCGEGVAVPMRGAMGGGKNVQDDILFLLFPFPPPLLPPLCCRKAPLPPTGPPTEATSRPSARSWRQAPTRPQPTR